MTLLSYVRRQRLRQGSQGDRQRSQTLPLCRLCNGPALFPSPSSSLLRPSWTTPASRARWVVLQIRVPWVRFMRVPCYFTLLWRIVQVTCRYGAAPWMPHVLCNVRASAATQPPWRPRLVLVKGPSLLVTIVGLYGTPYSNPFSSHNGDP